MNNAINALGLAIIAAKYAVVFLFAGLTISTGVIASEMIVMMGVETGE